MYNIIKYVYYYWLVQFTSMSGSVFNMKYYFPSKSALCQFMHKQIDNGNPSAQGLLRNRFSRMDCIRTINRYVKIKQLGNQRSFSYINADLTLEKIFPELKGVTGTQRLNYRSIPMHLGPHFWNIAPNASTIIQHYSRHYLNIKINKKKMTELKVVLLGDPMAKQIVHSSRLLFQKVYTYL